MDFIQDTLFQQLAYVCSETRQAFDHLIGMSQPRRQLLTLVEKEGPIRHSTLQQKLALDGAMLTRLVKEFEAEGILSRCLDPHNNRFTLVSLTETGKHTVAELRATHQAFQERLLVGISREEQEMMVSILERLRSNVCSVRSEEEA